MLFNSLEFLLFLPAVLVLYYLLPLRAQNLWLLAASYFFYGWWDYRFLGLILLSTAVDYACGLLIHRSEQRARRRALLTASIVCNLTILGFFKYFDFFYDSAVQALAAMGVTAPQLALRIILPVGISFYTFQSMSYTIDIYRERVTPTRHLPTFALYVAFFPQLVAGPIERAANLLPQIAQRRTVSGYQVLSGLWLILIGYFKKVVIGDGVAGFVDEAFSDPSSLSGAMALGAAYLFAVQIYGDFSGYSDIARGCARLMGIELMVNFRQPYLATSMGEFWRRWHISLSTWFRDYLYIPLGGNRHGKLQTQRNLWTTFLVTGLWHGANWTFLLWGILHGMFLVIERVAGLRPRVPYSDGLTSGGLAASAIRALRMFMVFNLAALTFIFFRGVSIGDGWDVFAAILSGPLQGEWTNLQRFLLYGGMLLTYDLAQERLKSDEPCPLFLPPILSALIAALLFLAIFVFGGQVRAFIYFQF